MAEGNGTIRLVGFDLDPAEKAIVDNLIASYNHKISERSSYESLRLRLRKSRKGKTFLHEVEGELRVKKNLFSAKATGYNLFSVLADVFEKLLSELVHSMRN